MKFPRDSKNKQPANDLAWLWTEAERRGWDPYGAFALIREESAWNPAIRNSIGATGLIQVTNSTARSMFGLLDASPIGRMGFREQLEKIAFPYWDRMSQVKKYRGPVSFFLWGLGGGTGKADPNDGTNILYAAGSAGAKGNPHLLNKVSGNLTEGSAMRFFAPFIEMQRTAPHEELSPVSTGEKKNDNCPTCPHCGGRVRLVEGD
jgi:hypothetical protein